MLYNTLNSAMKTKADPVVLSIGPFEYKGEKRLAIKARKARGKVTYRVVLYENGKYSEAV